MFHFPKSFSKLKPQKNTLHLLGGYEWIGGYTLRKTLNSLLERRGTDLEERRKNLPFER